jgi:SpoVK/Ycf46/Vps4 family AAA+-type ATPase
MIDPLPRPGWDARFAGLGVVNELLVQLQSFDTPPLGERLAGRLIDWVNGWLPATSQLAKRPPRYNNILVIAATNRADALDPALLRPGRFDRRLYFDLPNAAGRRELIDYFLATKSRSSGPLPARGGPSLLASRPAPVGELADPGQAG